jgi:plastocyanin
MSGMITVSGSIRKDPSAENRASCFVRMLQNSIQVWPVSGWAEVLPDYEKTTNYAISNVRVAAGDKIRFVVKHNGENRADPIVWNPTIVYRDAPP